MIWLILFIPIALGVGMATVTSPRRTAWLIGFTLATNAADVLRQRFGVEEYTNLLAVAALGFGLLQLMASLPRLRRPRSLPMGVAAATSVAVASALAGPFVAIQPEIAIEASSRLLINLLLAVAVLVVARRESGMMALLQGFAIGTSLLAFLTTVQALTGLQENDFLGFARWSSEEIAGIEGEANRATGAFRDDANQYGQVLVMAIGCAIGLGWLKRQATTLRTFACRGSLLLMCIAVSQTASRTAFLALAVVMLVAVMLAKPSPRQWSLVALVVLVLVLGPFGVRDRLSSLADLPALFDPNTSIESSASGRVSVMLSAVEMFEDNPVLGVGYGAYNDRYLEYSRSFGLDDRGRELSAHSLPLEVMAEEGLVGLTAWFAFLAFTGVALMRIRHTTIGQSLIFMMVAYLSTGLLLHDIYGRLRWSFVALLFHAARMASQRASDYLPLRVAVVTDEGMAVRKGRKQTKFRRETLSDSIELGVVGTVSIWPDIRRLKSRDIIGASNSELLHQLRNRMATRIALFRFDPHVVHAMGGSSTLRTATAHRREMGGRLIVDLADLLIAELLAGRRRLTAARLIPQGDYVVTGRSLSHSESSLLKIAPEQQLTDARLDGTVRGGDTTSVLCDHDTYLDLLRGEPGHGREIGPATAKTRQQPAVTV